MQSVQTMPRAADEVVLLDDDGNVIGTAAKSSVHTDDTRLHLAFSCHVFDARGRLLVTRRAMNKKTWGGVWTNSFCGHPRPAEPLLDAVQRHAAQELGMTVQAVTPVLPYFRYRAIDARGMVENEICPVYTARTEGTPQPNPDEVVEIQWVEPADIATAIERAPWAFSPWFVLQSRLLPFLTVSGEGLTSGVRT